MVLYAFIFITSYICTCIQQLSFYVFGLYILKVSRFIDPKKYKSLESGGGEDKHNNPSGTNIML